MDIYERLATSVDQLRNTDKYKHTDTYHSLMDMIQHIVLTIFSGNPISLCLRYNNELNTLSVLFRIYYTNCLYLEYVGGEYQAERRISPSTWKKICLDARKAFRSSTVGSITFKEDNKNDTF